ncbi:MAG: four helix bundle protein [Deltaproteobacteria bacterium]|nr:four helix bundle protein [Deltaproteobacteria bacterium]
MGVQDLEVYKIAEKLSDVIWNIVSSWDHFSKMTLGRQLVESADSVAANIAEGYGRYHFRENKNFCYYARGSLEETKVWLRKSVRRNLLDMSQHSELEEMIEVLPKRLNAYISSIGRRCGSASTDH